MPATPVAAPNPPAKTDPGQDPGQITVDEYYVEAQGAENLPNGEAADEYRALARDGVFTDLAAKVVDSSGVKTQEFEKEMVALAKQVSKARVELDTKKDGDSPARPVGEFDPLPGVVDDPVCRSRFDVSDLALANQKAVTARRFNQPLVMLDSALHASAAAKPWLLGQKLEFSQEWRHSGFTLGEIVSSLSLLPGEELTIEVSTFQRTKQEIQNEKDDTKRTELLNEQKNTDERSCTNQTAASNGWSVSATASVNYPVASASISAGANGSSSEQAQHSRRQLNEATTRSATEISSRRAVKITQTSEAGSEATTTRRLRNPNTCQTVTFNFFQVVKLFDVQLRMISDRPVLLLPDIFPRFYGPQAVRRGEGSTALRPTEVGIPVHLIEGWRSPAVFLTKYFEVDRELSAQISGWALKVRADPEQSPTSWVNLLAEALVVASKFLFGVDPALSIKTLGATVADLCAQMLATRIQVASQYGKDLGQVLQINTPGVYVDALRGRCTACTDHDEAGQYVDVMTRQEELRRLSSANALDAQEIERRKRLLEANQLDPFEPAPQLVP